VSCCAIDSIEATLKPGAGGCTFRPAGVVRYAAGWVCGAAVGADSSMLTGNAAGEATGVCAVEDMAMGINMPNNPVAAERIGRRLLFWFIVWVPVRDCCDRF